MIYDGICSKDDKALFLLGRNGVELSYLPISTDCRRCIDSCDEDEQWTQCIEDECFAMDYGLIEKKGASPSPPAQVPRPPPPPAPAPPPTIDLKQQIKQQILAQAEAAVANIASQQMADQATAVKQNHQCDKSMLWKSTLGSTCDDPAVEADWRDQSGKPAGNYCSKFCAHDLVMKALQDPNYADWDTGPNWRSDAVHNQSYGCRINNDDWSNSCNRDEIEKRCMADPRCVGYYSTGICFVATDKKPGDCHETATDTGRYEYFVRKRGREEAEKLGRVMSSNGASTTSGVGPATVPAHVQVPAPPLGIPTEAEIMESRAKHWGSPPTVPQLQPTSSCYNAMNRRGEPEREDSCCTCEDVKEAFAGTFEKMPDDVWQCMSPNNNKCLSDGLAGIDWTRVIAAAQEQEKTQAQAPTGASITSGVNSMSGVGPGATSPATVTQSHDVLEGIDSSSTTSTPFNLGHLNFSELNFSGLSGLSGLNINPDGTVNHDAQAQVQAPSQAGIKQPPNGWVSVQAAKRNPDGSWGCKLMTDWSSVPKNNEQSLQAACKNDPKCVGYYDNGVWLVASNTYPELCDEPGQPEYPYGTFVKNPNVAPTGASMTSSVNSMSGVGQGATSPATVTQSQEVQLQLQPSLSNGVGVSTMSGFSPPTAMLDSANATANGSAIGQMNVNDALSGLNRRSATPPTTVAQSQEVQLQPNLSNGFGANTMSGFSPPTAAQDQAVLDSANAAAIGSAIGQMNLNDALSGLSGLTDPQSLAGLVVGDNPGRACTGKMQLRTLDEQSRGDEHENDWRHACVEGCKFDANCQIATVIKNNFTGNLRCVHSAGPVTRDECSGGNGFYTYRK